MKNIDNNLICNLCAGSPDIQRYKIKTKNKTIYTDICIGKEIKYLIQNNIKTFGCCCGHGQNRPNCLVSLNNKSKLEELGYKIYKFSKTHTKYNIGIIYLYTDVQCELRKVLQNKVFNYLKKNNV